MHGEYIKAEQAEQKAKADLEKTQNEIKALEHDNKILKEKISEAQKKYDAAKKEKDKLDKEKETKLQPQVNKYETVLKNAGDKAKQYKADLDRLYQDQTTQQGKIDEFTAKMQAESQKQDTIQERTDSIIKAMNGEYADEGKAKWYNPFSWF